MEETRGGETKRGAEILGEAPGEIRIGEGTGEETGTVAIAIAVANLQRARKKSASLRGAREKSGSPAGIASERRGPNLARKHRLRDRPLDL